MEEILYISTPLRMALIKLFPLIAIKTDQVQYGFNYIMISHTDPTKLSGMAVNLGFTGWPYSPEREERGTFLKPGKFLRAIYPDCGDEISTMAAKLAKHLTGEDDSKLSQLQVSDTPSYVYNIEHEERGSIGGSCMRHLGTEIFEMYDLSPTTRILYMEEDGYLIARALLHGSVKDIQTGGELQLMDRIYTTNENLEATFNRWAVKNRYHRKRYQSCDERRFIVTPDGRELTMDLSIELPKSKFRKVPYMDTFIFYTGDNLINTSHYNHTDCLSDVEGSSETQRIVYVIKYNCHMCGANIYEDDACYPYRGNTRAVCLECYDHSHECNQCGHPSNVGSFVIVNYRGWEQEVCISCGHNMINCEECGTSEFRTRIYRVDNRSVCAGCYSDRLYCREHDINYIGECSHCKAEVEYKQKLEEVWKGLKERLAQYRVKNCERFAILLGGNHYELYRAHTSVNVARVVMNMFDTREVRNTFIEMDMQNLFSSEQLIISILNDLMQDLGTEVLELTLPWEEEDYIPSLDDERDCVVAEGSDSNLYTRAIRSPGYSLSIDDDGNLHVGQEDEEEESIAY